MFIEDLIHRLAGDSQYIFLDPVSVSPTDVTIISSLSSQILMGNGFTEKQSTLALHLVKKYAKVLSVSLNKDVIPFISEPEFKLPFRVLANSKMLTIKKGSLGNDRLISASFPYNEELVGRIKTYKSDVQKRLGIGSTINWNPENRSWDFDLREDHLDWICNNLMDSSFIADDILLDIINQITDVKNNLENHIPMVVFENNKFVFKNVPSKVPQPDNFDIIETLVQARRHGITTWSEDIDEVLSKIEINPILLKVLTSSDITTLPCGREKLTISDLTDIVKHSLPCLVIIPGGTELRHLTFCRDLFQKEGISTEEMSVLFRLDSKEGKDFNNFVKDSKLNNPISEKIKVFFISGKVPKPLIESKMIFSSILNLGISGVHYTLSNYIKNHHFVINYTLKESDFALL